MGGSNQAFSLCYYDLNKILYCLEKMTFYSLYKELAN